MQEQINTRELVMEMLLEVTKKNAYSHVMIREVLDKYDYLSTQEKSFMKRVFEGTLERMIQIDYVINQFSKVEVRKMKPVIRVIMRMSVYQILFMESVPDSAACNEAVKLAKKKGFSTLTGFVNAVLRNVTRNKDAIRYPDASKNRENYFSVVYSMPQWIIDLWKKQYDMDTIESILRGLLEEHPVTIRLRAVDRLSEISEAVEQRGGRMIQHPYMSNAYLLEKTDNLKQLPGYEDGAFMVQDVSSMLAVTCLGLKDNSKVLDICAAPGGKSMMAYDLMHGTGSIEARDVSEKKVWLMQDNFDRCQMDNVKAVVYDATKSDEALIGQMDYVICDLPCSGLGIMGKKRDIKYNILPESIGEIIALQEDILEKAVSYLKPGGRLLFSTCTINKKENEDHVTLLSEKYKLTPVSLDEYLPDELCCETTKKGYIQLLPGIHKTDGFFISVFEK